MTHDFIKFPELTNGQMDFYYMESPHKQIFEDFDAEVVKVTDGDTIRVKTDFRDFDFPVRFANTNAPEMAEGGKEARSWLEQLILNQKVKILVNKKKRVGKFGRLLGIIEFKGLNINQESITLGLAKPFSRRNEGKIPNINLELNIDKWL